MMCRIGSGSGGDGEREEGGYDKLPVDEMCKRRGREWETETWHLMME